MVVSILIVWFLVGLWHGSQLNYIVTCLYDGICIVIYLFIRKYNVSNNLNSYLKMLFTFIFISFGIFILKITSLTELIDILYKIVQQPISNNILTELNLSVFSSYDWSITIFGIFVLLIVDFLKYKNKFNMNNLKINYIIIYVLLFLIITCGKFDQTNFIYIKF